MTFFIPTVPLFLALSAPGMGEWAVILVIVLVLFGGKNIPDLARTLGKGVRDFKRAMNGIGDSDPNSEPSPAKSAEPIQSIEPREPNRPRSS